MGDLKGSAKQPGLRLKGLGQAGGLGQLGGSGQAVGRQAFSNLNPRPGHFSTSGPIKFQLCFFFVLVISSLSLFLVFIQLQSSCVSVCVFCGLVCAG